VLLWGLAAIGIAWEWNALVAGPGLGATLVINWAVLVAATVLLGLGRIPAGAAILVFGTLGAAGLGVPSRKGWALAGAVSTAAALAAPVVLRSDAEWGFIAVILLFAVVWTTDVMAYFLGRLIGGPKLWPAVSPKKTWSGAIGGMMAGVIAGFAVATFAGIGNLLAVGLVCAALSVIAEGGDLLESAVKRHFGAKDASHLIPGHGGLMDRLDGFVTAAGAAALLGLLRGGIDAPARGLLIW